MGVPVVIHATGEYDGSELLEGGGPIGAGVAADRMPDALCAGSERQPRVLRDGGHGLEDMQGQWGAAWHTGGDPGDLVGVAVAVPCTVRADGPGQVGGEPAVRQLGELEDGERTRAVVEPRKALEHAHEPGPLRGA